MITRGGSTVVAGIATSYLWQPLPSWARQRLAWRTGPNSASSFSKLTTAAARLISVGIVPPADGAIPRLPLVTFPVADILATHEIAHLGRGIGTIGVPSLVGRGTGWKIYAVVASLCWAIGRSTFRMTVVRGHRAVPASRAT